MNKELYKQVGDLARKWKHYPNEYNPADPDNRRILVEKNMKLAINIALKYRNLGVEEDDLVGAALLGLSVAYEKYNPDQAALKNRLLAAINDSTTPDDFVQIMAENMSYGTDVCKLFESGIPETPGEMVTWVSRNIRPAKFTSVAAMWVRAYVLAELDKYGTPVRVPESARGEAAFERIDDDLPGFDRKQVAPSDEETEEREEAWERLWTGVPCECRRVVEQRYGIGVDAAMTLREIAAYWGRDIGWVKRALTDCVEGLRDNARRYGLQMPVMI